MISEKLKRYRIAPEEEPAVGVIMGQTRYGRRFGGVYSYLGPSCGEVKMFLKIQTGEVWMVSIFENPNRLPDSKDYIGDKYGTPQYRTLSEVARTAGELMNEDMDIAAKVYSRKVTLRAGLDRKITK